MSRRTPERDGAAVAPEDDELAVVTETSSGRASRRPAVKRTASPRTTRAAADAKRPVAVEADEPDDDTADAAVDAADDDTADATDPAEETAAEPAPELPDEAPDPAVAAQALRELWEDFKDTGQPQLRERLILHYSPLVKYVAGRVG